MTPKLRRKGHISCVLPLLRGAHWWVEDDGSLPGEGRVPTVFRGSCPPTWLQMVAFLELGLMSSLYIETSRGVTFTVKDKQVLKKTHLWNTWWHVPGGGVQGVLQEGLRSARPSRRTLSSGSSSFCNKVGTDLDMTLILGAESLKTCNKVFLKCLVLKTSSR